MAKKITIATQKGGTGKTTVSSNVAAGLALKGKKTLLIDMDPQGDSTISVGIDKSSLKNTVYHILTDRAKIKDVIMPIALKNVKGEIIDKDHFFMLPANLDLASAETELMGQVGRGFVLKESLDLIEHDFDWIIIDTPPSLGILTVNALTSSDRVIIPIQTHFYALEGTTKLMQTIEMIKRRLNKNLELGGVVLTMYDGRTKLAKEIVSVVNEHFNKKVFNSIIPQNISLAEAPSVGIPGIIYAPKAKGSLALLELIDEIENME